MCLVAPNGYMMTFVARNLSNFLQISWIESAHNNHRLLIEEKFFNCSSKDHFTFAEHDYELRDDFDFREQVSRAFVGFEVLSGSDGLCVRIQIDLIARRRWRRSRRRRFSNH